jgi:prepilin-type N-terminal cleavage/methylation domain-containing protein
MRKAFTLIEMVVALGILAVVLSFAGVIFRVSIESQRLALANAQIMQKLRVITEQLDADFRGLRKDGEILVIWSARRKSGFAGPTLNDPRAFERFDRIMFFTAGDFQTYNAAPPARGNLARVCYTLARTPSTNPAQPSRPPQQAPPERILARTQHILAPSADRANRFNPSSFSDNQWLAWNSQREYDDIALAEWKEIPLPVKVNILSVIGDIEVRGPPNSTTGDGARGVLIDRAQPAALTTMLCEGVGQFMVQGWSDAQRRWIPEVNPNGDGSLADSDFLLAGADLDPVLNPGVWYPWGAVTLGNNQSYPSSQMDEEHLHEIPGLGPALKFTFTLYDSHGVIRNGRTFTHIVYLDD